MIKCLQSYSCKQTVSTLKLVPLMLRICLVIAREAIATLCNLMQSIVVLSRKNIYRYLRRQCMNECYHIDYCLKRVEADVTHLLEGQVQENYVGLSAKN